MAEDEVEEEEEQQKDFQVEKFIAPRRPWKVITLLVSFSSCVTYRNKNQMDNLRAEGGNTFRNVWHTVSWTKRGIASATNVPSSNRSSEEAAQGKANRDGAVEQMMDRDMDIISFSRRASSSGSSMSLKSDEAYLHRHCIDWTVEFDRIDIRR